MRYGFYFILVLALVFGAYQVAQNKMTSSQNLNSLRLGMTARDIKQNFGTPSAHTRNLYTYILDDGSELFITLRDEKVSSAKVKFHKTVKIQDPDMKTLSLVQMDMHDVGSNSPSWFFAGKPEEGLIYKITAAGTVESITWVPPFTYGNNRPKHLGALLNDFRSQQVSNL